MANTHRALKQWCLTKVETVNSFENWRHVGLQIYKMINLGSNVIVYKLKHCVLHFEVNMMTF